MLVFFIGSMLLTKNQRLGMKTFNQSSQFFDELIELTATGKMIRIDHNYCNKIINGK
ncbi:MAG: hypothetical protein M3Q77_09345 [Thermoproteota archaeon]|nr:hypothetical protein [Thermoproteota archaeon]